MMAHKDPDRKAEYAAEYRRTHRAEHAAYVREWHRAHPGYNKSRMLKRAYGITLDDFDAMVAEQGGRCAICGVDPPRLSVDHDHATGQVRGLLCDSCNNGLGRFRDNPDSLMAAAAYLLRTTTIT